MTKDVGPERGETLLEILMAVAILGVASTGLIMGLSTGLFATDSHRRLSAGESTLRAYGELAKAAVLHPAQTVTTSAVGPFSKEDGSLTIGVASTSDFPSSFPYTIALGDSLILVSAKTGTTFTGEPLAGGLFASGEEVRRYESCPNAAYFADILSAHPELGEMDRLGEPEIGEIAFFDIAKSEVDCEEFRGEDGETICAVTGDQRTVCDPPWLRLALSIESTDAGRSRTTLTSEIVIRRAA